MKSNRVVDSDMRAKMKEYSDGVKENHAPVVDEKKRTQMGAKLENVKSLFEKEEEYKERMKNKGFENMEFIRKLPKKKKAQTADEIRCVPLKQKY